ncbi:MAG: Holliday junction branch migration DNA helicase RuvB [Chlamydiota bacterium]
MKNTHIQSTWTKPDPTYDLTLRPQYLEDFMGQDSLKERLKIVIGASKKRKETLGHCLFHGPPGLGKTTLASVIANEMQSRIVVTSGPVIEKAGDLAGIMTTLEEGDILFIDEIHRLPRQIEEYLYPAMEDFSLDLMLDSGPQARSVQVKLNPFTLIGATTRMGLLSSPLRSRFGFHCRLDFYTPDILEKILVRSASLLSMSLSKEAAYEIALRSRGTPRIANNLLRWVRDFAEMRSESCISIKTVHQALQMLSIDEKGLDEMDKKILTTIIDHHEGGPVGIKTLAAALGEDDTTLAEVYEPYLIMLGLLRITLRGREATKLAFEHFNRPSSSIHQQGELS